VNRCSPPPLASAPTFGVGALAQNVVNKHSGSFERAALSALPDPETALIGFVYNCFQCNKRSQQFICMNNETLSVAMRVHNPDRSPFNIQS
jgi:hypothetical protein